MCLGLNFSFVQGTNSMELVHPQSPDFNAVSCINSYVHIKFHCELLVKLQDIFIFHTLHSYNKIPYTNYQENINGFMSSKSKQRKVGNTGSFSSWPKAMVGNKQLDLLQEIKRYVVRPCLSVCSHPGLRASSLPRACPSNLRTSHQPPSLKDDITFPTTIILVTEIPVTVESSWTLNSYPNHRRTTVVNYILCKDIILTQNKQQSILLNFQYLVKA